MGAKRAAVGAENRTAWRVLAWAGVALQFVALVFVLWSQKWGGAWTIALFGAMSVTFLLMQDRLPSLIDFLVVLAALLNAGSWAWEWYQTFVWFDEFVHAFTSFAVVSALTWLAWSRRWIGAAAGAGKFVLWAVVLGFGLGIVWEVFESLFLNLAVWDTIVDLIMDTIGAALGGWFIGRITKAERSCPNGYGSLQLVAFVACRAADPQRCEDRAMLFAGHAAGRLSGPGTERPRDVEAEHPGFA